MRYPSQTRSFAIAFLGLLALSMASMAAFSIAVDPFWRFDLVNIAGFNAQRVQFATNARLGKAGVACRLRLATAIFGTSRVEVGIDPTHPALSNLPGPVYNMALAGSGLREVDLTIRHAVNASGSLKHILLGLDFLMFNANREAVVFETEVINFDPHRLILSNYDTCSRTFIYDMSVLLGPRALFDSFITVKNQRTEPNVVNMPAINDWIANYDQNGLRHNFYVIDKLLVTAIGYRKIFGEDQERHYLKAVWRPAPEQRYCFVREAVNAFAIFRGILDFARRSGIDLRIFINPVHARLLLAVREGGLWPTYEDWKQKLVEVLAAEAAASGKPQFRLWDFSGFNSVTTEHVPPASDTTTVVKGFWEPSHYKKETGDVMLDRMFDYSDPMRTAPGDFGRLLTPATIDNWIMDSRVGMRNYMKTEPTEAALVKAIADDVMTDSEGSNCGYDVQALREGSAAQRRGDTVAADAAFVRAVALHEADRRRHAQLDVPYREIGWDRLLAEARAGILEQPLPTWQAYQERGIRRSQSGDHLRAAEDFASAIRLGPANTALHYMRGVALLNANYKPEAAKEFERGLKLEPANPALAHLLLQARGEERVH
jgi:tetratricopeptide (TPR) repeat protein